MRPWTGSGVRTRALRHAGSNVVVMRIVKYPQSCLVVETGEARLLVDPGSFATAAYEPATFGPVDAVLYTHRHQDHFDPGLLDALAEAGTTFVANGDVASLMGDHDAVVLEDGDETTVRGVRVRAHHPGRRVAGTAEQRVRDRRPVPAPRRRGRRPR